MAAKILAGELEPAISNAEVQQTCSVCVAVLGLAVMVQWMPDKTPLLCLTQSGRPHQPGEVYAL